MAAHIAAPSSYIMDTTMTHALLQPFVAMHHNDNYSAGKRTLPPPLFATYSPPGYPARRVRVVGASKHGRIGITEHLHEETRPQLFVPQAHLSQFLPTAYPMQPVHVSHNVPGQDRRRREARLIAAARVARLRRTLSVDGAGLAARAASILGISEEDILGDGMTHLSVSIRRALLGMLAVRHRDYSLSMLASFVNVHHSSAYHALAAAGLRGQAVSEFDMPYLRAAWRGLGLPQGYWPGQMPPEVRSRLGKLVRLHGGLVEPAAWTDVRRWLALRIFDERMGEHKCAA